MEKPILPNADLSVSLTTTCFVKIQPPVANAIVYIYLPSKFSLLPLGLISPANSKNSVGVGFGYKTLYPSFLA